MGLKFCREYINKRNNTFFIFFFIMNYTNILKQGQLCSILWCCHFSGALFQLCGTYSSCGSDSARAPRLQIKLTAKFCHHLGHTTKHQQCTQRRSVSYFYGAIQEIMKLLTNESPVIKFESFHVFKCFGMGNSIFSIL